MDAVLSVNREKEARKQYMTRYQQIMDSINLLTEVSRIIYQIFMSLKQTSKIMSETTYSWKQFCLICDRLILNIIHKAKIKKAGRASSLSAASVSDDQTQKTSNIELEIDQEFFSTKVVPVIHQVMLSNIKIESKSFFNFILSMRIGLLYGSLTIEEYQYILNQLIKLKEFWKWRHPNHSFVDAGEIVDKNLIKDIRQTCFKFYPEATLRRIFEHINTKLG